MDTVRHVERRDFEGIRELLANVPEAAQWTHEDVAPESRRDLRFRVAEGEGRICGLIVFRRMADEAEILNLAVESNRRRRGIGSWLIREAIAECKSSGVKRIFLEVRESNRGAREFYASMGFRDMGRRKNYYQQPVEDALLLFRTVS